MNFEASIRLSILGADDRLGITELFHRVNRLLPVDQEIVSVSPETKVGDALQQMKEHHFSQVPVVAGQEVVGLFSYRSLALKLPEIDPKKHNPVELPVEEAMEILDAAKFTHIDGEYQAIIETLDRDDAVLIGEPRRLQGIVTAMNVVRKLYEFASPYFLLEEIELSVRRLMREAMNDADLAKCSKACLTDKYDPDPVPTRLEEMSFNDYVQIIGYGRHWEQFKPVFGGARDRTRARLKVVGELRNDIFHFRRTITIEDHQELRDTRSWILMRSRIIDARVGKGGAAHA